MAGLGLKGVAMVMGITLKGSLPWLTHRGNHGGSSARFAMPAVECKFRVMADWSSAPTSAWSRGSCGLNFGHAARLRGCSRPQATCGAWVLLYDGNRRRATCVEHQ